MKIINGIMTEVNEDGHVVAIKSDVSEVILSKNDLVKLINEIIDEREKNKELKEKEDRLNTINAISKFIKERQNESDKNK